jgi:hypothetical protein
MSKDTLIHIVSKSTCSFTHRGKDEKQIQIDYQPEYRVWFEYTESEDLRERMSVLCVYRAVNIKSKFAEELRSIASGEYEQQGVPFTVDVEKKRKQRSEFPSGLSSGAEDRLGQLTSEMKEVAERFVSKLRWRLDLGGRGRVFQAAPKIFWSEDAKTWMTLPSKMFVDFEVRRDFLVDSLSDVLLSDLKLNDLAEPIAHRLFREAWSKRHGDHEAALMQGVVALEVGVKNCIVALLPTAEYLILEMPSPPVAKLLQDFLPTLAEKTKVEAPSLSPSIIESITNMIHQRNLLVHKGKTTVDLSRVIEYLEIIHDLLYFLDFISGNNWALALTSRDFKVWLRNELPHMDFADPLAYPGSTGEPSDAPEP